MAAEASLLSRAAASLLSRAARPCPAEPGPRSAFSPSQVSVGGPRCGWRRWVANGGRDSDRCAVQGSVGAPGGGGCRWYQRGPPPMGENIGFAAPCKKTTSSSEAEAADAHTKGTSLDFLPPKAETSPRDPPLLRATCPGPFGFTSKALPSVLTSGRRHTSSWAWTPWEPKRPTESPMPPLGVDDVVKFIEALKASSQDEAKLKRVFFDKFYGGKPEDPTTVNLKLDLLLHKVDENTRLIKEIKGDKKWGTFVLFGKKVDLASLAAAFLGMF